MEYLFRWLHVVVGGLCSSRLARVEVPVLRVPWVGVQVSMVAASILIQLPPVRSAPFPKHSRVGAPFLLYLILLDLHHLRFLEGHDWVLIIVPLSLTLLSI